MVRRVGSPDEYTVHHQPHHSWTLRRRNRVIWQTRYELHGRRFHPDGYWIDAEAESEEWSIPFGRQWQSLGDAIAPTRRRVFDKLRAVGFLKSKRGKRSFEDWKRIAPLLGPYRLGSTYLMLNCPDHEGDKASRMAVYPDRFSTANCFSCGRKWTFEELEAIARGKGDE